MINYNVPPILLLQMRNHQLTIYHIRYAQKQSQAVIVVRLW